VYIQVRNPLEYAQRHGIPISGVFSRIEKTRRDAQRAPHEIFRTMESPGRIVARIESFPRSAAEYMEAQDET
jgi:hypothetical protein